MGINVRETDTGIPAGVTYKQLSRISTFSDLVWTFERVQVLLSLEMKRSNGSTCTTCRCAERTLPDIGALERRENLPSLKHEHGLEGLRWVSQSFRCVLSTKKKSTGIEAKEHSKTNCLEESTTRHPGKHACRTRG